MSRHTRQRSSAALLGLLVLLALGLLAGGEPNASADPVALLPARLQQQGRAILAEADEARRVELVRELGRERVLAPVLAPESTAFLLALLERDASAAVRYRIVSSVAADRSAASRVALEAVASSDADVSVSLRALELLHERRALELVELLEARMAATPAPDALAAERMRTAHDHWLTVARGGLLPAFMRTPPPLFAAAPSDRPVRVAAFGDFGRAEEPFQRQVADALARAHAQRAFDFGITLGDNFYPRGMTSPADSRWMPLWTEMYERLGIPFYATLGNHDWADPDSPAAEVLFSAQSASWRLPATRYTFSAGPAQFFALDTQALSAAQLAWLDAELGRSRARWKIVYGHHPIRSVGVHGDSPELLAKLLPVLAGRAQVYIAGHDHDMQHLAPESGVQLFVAGSGGAGVRPVRPEPRALFARAAHGFAVLDISLERLEVEFVGTDGQRLYRYTLQ